MGTAEHIAFACMMVFTAVAFVWDLRTQKLPNVLTVPVFVVGVLFHATVGQGLLFSLWGFAVGFGIMLILWFLGGGGGGDVKFVGALGAWLGAWLTFQTLCLSALISGALTIAILTNKVFRLKRLSSRSPSKKKASASAVHRSKLGWRVPFGVPAAVGTWCILLLYWFGYVLPWPPIR